MPSARLFPSSGNFLGPNKSRAISATSNQCHGENSPTRTSTEPTTKLPISRVVERFGEVKPPPWGRRQCPAVTSVTLPPASRKGYVSGGIRARYEVRKPLHASYSTHFGESGEN